MLMYLGICALVIRHTLGIGIMKVIILLSFVAVAFATPECGENSHYESCGTACPVTCKNYQNPPIFCVKMCNPGCHCDEGYVKTDDGRCVAPEECPAQTDEVCGENQVFNGCGTACPLTCDNYQNPPKICTMQCVIGCECAKGFVKSRDGRCVRPEECPASGSNPLDPVECGENQVFKTCGTACPLTCDNYQNPPKFCTLQCIIGCACANGFVKTRDGRCVRPEECPASAQQKTCQGEGETGMCKAYFPSWYYDGKSGQCKKFIYGGCGGNGNRYSTEEECMKNCGVLDVLIQSSEPLGTCEHPPETGPCRALLPRYFFRLMTGECEKFVYGGCQGNSNNFETLEECEQTCGGKCGENEHYSACGSACPMTCDNFPTGHKSCTQQCIIGCQCRVGFVKNRDGRCVRPEECPSNPLTPECGKNQVFTSCGTACPLTCDNYHNPPRACTLQCIIGCECEEGFVKTRDGRCVKSEECPASAQQKTCLGEGETGMCKAYFPSWYYDAKSGQCKRFIYGGCGGNGNRYSTEEECMEHCGGQAA